MIRRIKSLTNVFIKSFYQNLKIYDKEKKKIEKNSMLFWAILILAITIFYISQEVIDALVVEGQETIFLNLYFLVLAIFLIFQSILIATNVYFFSKDIEYILPMPVTSLELLLAKFNTMLSMLYVTEAIFGIVPLIMYGIKAQVHIGYYGLMLIALLLFPILIVASISSLTVFLMKFAKFFKNKQFFQTLVTLILTTCMLILEIVLIGDFAKMSEQNVNMVEAGQMEIDTNLVQESYNNLTKNFLIINPTIEILKKDTNFFHISYHLLELIGYHVLAVIIFILIGRKGYVKNILACATHSTKSHKKKKFKVADLKNNQVRHKGWEYIKKEVRNVLRHPIFFMQTILPVIIIIISLMNVVVFMIPVLDMAVQEEMTFRETLNSIPFNMEVVCVILGILQFLYSISGLSITAISREGRDAILIKYIPIDLYQQFLYKNVCQVFLNLILSILILGIVYYFMPSIGFLNLLLLFIISILINLINSYLMLVVDIRRPNLNWDSEYTVVKKNPNKIFQYVFMIIMILSLMYLSSIFKDFAIATHIALIIELVIFFILFFLIDLLVRKFKNKLFDKII